jgi:hypothetical protein
MVLGESFKASKMPRCAASIITLALIKAICVCTSGKGAIPLHLAILSRIFSGLAVSFIGQKTEKPASVCLCTTEQQNAGYLLIPVIGRLSCKRIACKYN